MSPGDFMGLCAFLIATISVFAIMAGAYKRRLAFLERKLEITAGASTRLAAEKAAQYAAHNAALENRVRVLERILTDGGSALGLAHQIEALRETPVHDNPARDDARLDVRPATIDSLLGTTPLIDTSPEPRKAIMQ